jgi:hypothetical protein
VRALENQSFDFKEGERNMLVIGTTGSVRSTLINWLNGCKLRLLTPAEKSEFGLDFDAVCVDNKGPKSEICDIGQGNVSRTQSVKKVPIEGTSFVIWDFPGFFDTKGPTTEIIHAAVLSKFMNDSLSSGIILMLTTQEPDLAASRGQDICQMIERIANIFGGDNMRMKLDGIIFCLTKPVQLTKSSYGKHIHSVLTTKWEQVGSEFHTVVFDPFDKVKHKMTQKPMLDILGRATPIQGKFSMALEPAAEIKLREIVHFSIDHVQELLIADEPSSSQIATAFRNFHMISSIHHPIVFAGIEHCKMIIVNFVRQGLTKP